MGASLIDDVVAGRTPRILRLTVEQYHRMLEGGILHEGDPVELVEGFLVRKDREEGGMVLKANR